MSDIETSSASSQHSLDDAAGRTLIARAFLLGERLDVRGFDQRHALATTPLTVSAGRKGHAVLFRYGVVVLFDVSAGEEAHFLADLAGLVSDPLAQPGREQAHIDVVAGAAERVAADGSVVLAEVTPERLQIIADVLAKDVLLEHYEVRLAAVFDRVEPLAVRLTRGGRRNFSTDELLTQIGDVLGIKHRMVGRAEVLEKPEVLWNQPELEGLFLRLEREYEIRERSRALERKLEVVGDTVETLLDLVHTRRSLNVEWYIVALIVFEILLSLYQSFH